MRWLLVPLTIGLTGCGGDAPPAAPTPTPAALVRVDIEGPAQQEISGPGATLQLRAVATLADGARPDVTNEAAWSVTDSRVLTVSSRGLVTGVADGGTIVTALYRERAGVTTVRVVRPPALRYPVNGIVRDAETGIPIVDAAIHDQQGVVVHTDGNGFFETQVAGPASFTVGQFGYADASLVLPDVTAPTTVDVRLTPNPGAYIERTVEGELDTDEGGLAASATLAVSTRAGGIFDAVVEARSCDYNGSMQLTASSGGQTFVGRGDGASTDSGSSHRTAKSV